MNEPERHPGRVEKTPPRERLSIIEAALHQIREELKAPSALPSPGKGQKQLAAAAQALMADYGPGGELTVFTDLDGEEFHA
ncbi:MAG: hypothetical protein FJ126_09000 [Deltaproteobacteria bacterium]|nr:hypothetical protein [Deltaproteobacteria bacterium]